MNTAFYKTYMAYRNSAPLKPCKAIHAFDLAKQRRDKGSATLHWNGFRYNPTHCYEPSDQKGESFMFCETEDSLPGRFIGYADTLREMIRHNGWYTDEHCDSTLRGAVLQLSGKNRKERFLAGYQESDSEGFVFDLGEVFDDSSEAAYSADSMAERSAEKEREYQRVESINYQIEELQGEQSEYRRSCLAILGLRRVSPYGLAMVEAIVTNLLCERSRVFEEIETLREKV